MNYKTKSISAILFSLLITIYLIFFLLSFFMLLVISLPSNKSTKFDQMISYIMFSVFIFLCFMSLISCFLILYIKNLKWYFRWPAYFCLPISIPLIILTKKKNKKDFFDIQNNFVRKNSNLDISIIFIISCVFAFIVFIISFFFLLFEIINTKTEMILIFLPLFFFGLSILFGGFFNIFYYKNPTKVNKSLAWFGLIFTWWFLVYQDFMNQNLNF